MKLGPELELDAIDLQILDAIQDQGRIPLVKLGEQVGLSSPSVIERVKKLEDHGIITGYHASVDARRLGKDVTAFIGVSITHPKTIGLFEQAVALLDDVLECHHVTGEHTLLLKVKTDNTSSLERLIATVRSIEGVSRTETMVVLSTHMERTTIVVATHDDTAESAGNGHGRRRHASVKAAIADAGKRV